MQEIDYDNTVLCESQWRIQAANGLAASEGQSTGMAMGNIPTVPVCLETETGRSLERRS